METEGRLTPGDVAIAESNLRRFIQLMKTEAVFLGHSDRLDRDCFHAAHRRLERRSILTQFTLWPFWPNGVAWLRRTRQGLAPVAALSVARRGPYHESREGDSVFHLERDEEAAR